METTDLEAAVERVRAFLAERTRAHRGTEIIYSYGGMDGEVDLRHDDLEALVRALAPEADLGTESPRVTRARRHAARELGKALRGGDLLAAERRSVEAIEREDARDNG